MLDDLVSESLALCAQTEKDICSEVFERFFDTCPEARESLGHTDEPLRGRMLDGTFTLLLDADPDRYLRWEVDNHILAYGVYGDMYAPYFAAVKDSVAQALGDAWRPDHDAAWDTMTERLLRVVAEHIQQIAPERVST